ncbi:MAG: hypothetical protein MI743_05555 [Sneathiellales bacterium]|nr:hypothetical protein [Sneathiellales bacterium]
MRNSVEYIPSSMKQIDSQGDALMRYIAFKGHVLSEEDLFLLQNFICPDWLIHTMLTDAENPEHYVMDRYDERCLYDNRRDMTGLRMNEFEPDYICTSLPRYLRAKTEKRIILTHDTVLTRPSRSYLRFIFPYLSTDGEEKLLLSCRYTSIQEDVEDLDDLRLLTAKIA